MKVLARFAAFSCALAVPFGSASAQGPLPSAVALLAPRASRLAAELRRELEASSFETDDQPWREQLPAMAPAIVRGIAFVEGDTRAVLFTRTPSAAAAEIQRELTIDPEDRMARRRVFLALVEHLRLPPEPPAAPAPRALPVVEASPLPVAPPRQPWSLGAATTVNFDSTAREPTSHVLLIGLLPFGRHLDLSVRGLWPLVGSQFESEGARVRLWTFGVGAGLQLRLAPQSARLVPFVGLDLGVRTVLTDADWMEGAQSRVGATPSGTVSGQLGARLTVAPLLRLVFELEVGDSRALLDGDRPPYERAAANAHHAHAALGVLFDY